jgi:hypothetical protein
MGVRPAPVHLAKPLDKQGTTITITSFRGCSTRVRELSYN